VFPATLMFPLPCIVPEVTKFAVPFIPAHWIVPVKVGEALIILFPEPLLKIETKFLEASVCTE
jgi:hypothetical protein